MKIRVDGYLVAELPLRVLEGLEHNVHYRTVHENGKTHFVMIQDMVLNCKSDTKIYLFAGYTLHLS